MGFKTPKDSNDMSNFCGGKRVRKSALTFKMFLMFKFTIVFIDIIYYSRLVRFNTAIITFAQKLNEFIIKFLRIAVHQSFLRHKSSVYAGSVLHSTIWQFS